MDKIPVTIGILTYNSAGSLPRALDSVADFADIVICDGGSTDATLDIARAAGARVIPQDARFKNTDNTLKDFSGVRNQCLAAARYDWFLYIDSDENISPELHADIARIVREPLTSQSALVYRVPIGILMDGRYIKYSSNYPGYQHRFFNRKSGAHFDKPVHERIYFDTKVVRIGTLRHPWYVHTTRADWQRYFAKNRKYRDLETAMAAEQPLAVYLRYTLYGGLRLALGTLAKALWIRLRYGSRDAVPLAGELGRAATPLALLGRLTLAQLGWQSGKPARDDKTSAGPKRLYYVANNRIPTERAYGVQIVHMCAAFAEAGAEVTLALPRTGTHGDLFAAYGVPRTFSVAYLPVLNLPLWIPGAFELRTLSFARSVRRFLAYEEGAAIVYTRGEMALFLADIPARFTLAWETHMRPARPARYQRAVRRATSIVAITKHYAAEIPDIWKIKSKKVQYAPDGVSLAPFAHLPSREEARRELGLPLEREIVLYTGSDLPWKGLHLLREASELLPDTTLTVFVGPIKEIGTLSARRLFAGPQPYAKIPLWLAAADVLVLTGNPASETARYYTSPLKLFEYMAAKRPIVATDLPATRDVLDDATAYLAEPSAGGLAGAIHSALGNLEEAAVRAARARLLVERYTWDARARAILARVSSLSPLQR